MHEVRACAQHHGHFPSALHTGTVVGLPLMPWHSQCPAVHQYHARTGSVRKESWEHCSLPDSAARCSFQNHSMLQRHTCLACSREQLMLPQSLLLRALPVPIFAESESTLERGLRPLAASAPVPGVASATSPEHGNDFSCGESVMKLLANLVEQAIRTLPYGCSTYDDLSYHCADVEVYRIPIIV